MVGSERGAERFRIHASCCCVEESAFWDNWKYAECIASLADLDLENSRGVQDECHLLVMTAECQACHCSSMHPAAGYPAGAQLQQHGPLKGRPQGSRLQNIEIRAEIRCGEMAAHLSLRI